MTMRRSQAAMAIRIVLVGDTIRGLTEEHRNKDSYDVMSKGMI